MNGINNQFINPAITQDSNAALSTTFGESPDFLANSPQDGFQELARNTNEVEDFFHFSPNGQEIPAIPASLEKTGISSLNSSSGIPQELAAIAEKTLDVPLHRDEVEITPPQETQDVNTAKPSNQEFIKKRKSTWTKKEQERFIELKQQQPELPWKEFAKHFPGYTEKQCTSHWYNILAPRLYKEGKLTDLNAEDIDPSDVHANGIWTQEENKRFIELKQQQPRLPWKDFAKHFPEFTVQQCQNHWHCTLKIKLIRKRELPPDLNIKKLRIKFLSPAIPPIVGRENPNPFMNSSPATATSTNSRGTPEEKSTKEIPVSSREAGIAEENPDFLANSPQDGFQGLAGNTNEFEDFFHFSLDGQETPPIPASLEETVISSVNFSSGIPQELAGIAEKTPDVPLHHDEVGITPPQEIQDVNAAKPSNQEFIQKRKSAWTKKEDKRLIELKQQYPHLSWKDFAKHFPEYTDAQCRKRWYTIIPRLVQEGKLIDLNAEDRNPIAGTRDWSEEENKRFIKLKQQLPELPWKDFAEYFPGRRVEQCSHHWYNTLKAKLARKRGLTPDQNIDNPSNKKLRTTSPNSAIPTTFGGENPNPFMNSSPAISQELTGIAAPSLSHAFPIQQTSRDEQKKFLDLSFYQYEVAVHHFQEIQLTDPLLESIQREAAQCLANTQLTYQVIKQRLTIEASLIPILQQATSLITFCKTNTYYLETVYQHFLSYQANPESKEWFSSQNVVFTSLYCAFLKGNMEEAAFRHSLSLKGRDYSYQNLNNLFIRLKDVFKNHSSCFGLEYNKFIDRLFFNIEFQLNLLKDNKQNWMSIASLLKETILRMQEIEIFFQSCFNFIPSIETEANIIARLKNEISLQDFYAKQTANDGPKWT